jgi:hypothetical protein
MMVCPAVHIPLLSPFQRTGQLAASLQMTYPRLNPSTETYRKPDSRGLKVF